MDLKQFHKYTQTKAEWYHEVSLSAQKLLREDPSAQVAREYIDPRISAKNQELFGVGFFPEDGNLQTIYNLVPRFKLKRLNLVYNYHVQNGDVRVNTDRSILSQHNIILPYRDVSGNIIAFVGRTALPEDVRKSRELQKYKYTREFAKSYHLFGLYEAKKAIYDRNSVIVVEGQIDCVTCHEYGIHNVVALGGTSFSRRQLKLLLSYTDTVYLLLDNDEEGKRAQKKHIELYSKYAKIDKLTLPPGYKDVDECLRNSITPSIFLPN